MLLSRNYKAIISQKKTKTWRPKTPQAGDVAIQGHLKDTDVNLYHRFRQEWCVAESVPACMSLIFCVCFYGFVIIIVTNFLLFLELIFCMNFLVLQ